MCVPNLKSRQRVVKLVVPRAVDSYDFETSKNAGSCRELSMAPLQSASSKQYSNSPQAS